MTRSLQLARRDVHTWCVGLDVPPETAAGLYAALTNDERDRSARFRFEHDRRRFIVARGVLRELLGRYLRTNPGWIRFVYNAHGKPALGPEFGRRLRFNLSHSADLAIIAVAGDADVGVDLEHIRPQPDCSVIARQFFSAREVAELHRLPSHLHIEAFFSCWTKKEAYVKARGEGLSIPLTSFTVPLTAAAGHVHEILPARRWSLCTLRPASGYIGALAIEGSGWRPRRWRWQASLGDHGALGIEALGIEVRHPVRLERDRDLKIVLVDHLEVVGEVRGREPVVHPAVIREYVVELFGPELLGPAVDIMIAAV